MPELSLLTTMFLVFIVTQRLGELLLSRANTRLLRSKDVLECGQSLYPYLLCFQFLWLLGLLLAGHVELVNHSWLVCFFVFQVFHFWVIVTLGERWTIRLFIFNDPLSEIGPFKYFRYPQYLLNIAGTFIAPMVLGLWQMAIIFTALNAALLYLRLKEEKKGLAQLS